MRFRSLRWISKKHGIGSEAALQSGGDNYRFGVAVKKRFTQTRRREEFVLPVASEFLTKGSVNMNMLPFRLCRTRSQPLWMGVWYY